MGLESKGFIKSLEAVMSASLILIFVIGIFPTMQSHSEIKNNVFNLLSFVKNADDPEFRIAIINKDNNSISEKLKQEFPTKQINVGFLDLRSTKETLTKANTLVFSLEKAKSTKEILYIFLVNLENITIKLNNEEIYSKNQLEDKLSLEFDLTNKTNEGNNQLDLLGTFEKLDYILDFYYYEINAPDKDTVESISYFISGNQTILQPSTLVLMR